MEEQQLADVVSREQLQEWAKQRRERSKTVAVQEQQVKVVLFALADVWYAFFCANVREIIEISKRPVIYVPGSPEFIAGIINIRGVIQSIIDPYRLLKLAYNKESVQRHAIIIHHGEFQSGIRVDYIEEVMDIPQSALQSGVDWAINDTLRELIGQGFTYRDRHVAILDVSKLAQFIQR
ncbi:chemotaxis protein CheW [Candidatus Magnetaquicoccus inordinatus]|uniref:chemotaxis protein CheW n=1 Tax=Candidatus Magnetaquicoccus inordinatus TaxID=2496818 RepID=UPI00102CE6BF|nr:chemotaxis protein CheW [Candidatus Magnetaquicoccus inordinatus]